MEIDNLLCSSKKKDILTDLNRIRKEELDSFAPRIFEMYCEIENDPKKWELQAKTIELLGLFRYLPSKKRIEDICSKKIEYDLVSMYASKSLVRLERNSLFDGLPVINLLKLKCYSLTVGALNALGYDYMIPAEEQIKEIIQLSWNCHLNVGKEFTDPRYGLAAACVNWKPEQTKDFLNHCLESDDVPLKYIAEQSLKRKKVRLR